MTRPPRLLLLALFATSLLAAPAPAQEGAGGRAAAQTALTVTASATADGVRFVALGPAGRTRLEVYDASGAPVFDSGFLPGNVRDWSAAGLADGRYTCALTARDLAGRLSLRQGAVLVRGGRASIELGGAGGGEVEAQAARAGEAQAAAAPVEDEAAEAATLATHDGRAGSLTSTRGALSFRTGDLLSGGDRERMRLTEDGRLGVGTDDPEAVLDVAGAVRARGGFRFSDGTTLDSSGGKLTLTDAAGAPLPGPAAAGTGTQNRLAKWAETAGAGTLADSLVLESPGVGLQLTAPVSSSFATNIVYLDSTTKGTGFLAGSTPALTAANGPYFAMRGNAFTAVPGQRGAAVFAAGNVSNPTGREGTLLFMTGLNAVRMRVTPAGLVGVGLGENGLPQAMLHVGGNVNFTGLRTETTASAPNVVGGFGGNSVAAGVVGATIAGGGLTNNANTVSGSFGTIGGGQDNTVGGNHAVVAGGEENAANGTRASVGGGEGNSAGGNNAAVAGGNSNTASSSFAFVGGGSLNQASGLASAVGGGSVNRATGVEATIGGGSGNTASAGGATVPGGTSNAAGGANSFAAGRRAKALHAGAFVWADNIANADFASTAPDQFLVRAAGGVGIGTNAPTARLTVAGAGGFGTLGAARFDLTNTAAAATLSQHVNDFGTWQLSAGTVTRLSVTSSGDVGVGVTAPADRLHVNGAIRVTRLGAAGSTHLCHNASSQIASCSSSLRYKEGVEGFGRGLELVRRLRPVSFTWRGGGGRDLGFVAEEVGAAEPLLVTRNAAGEVEGVKYDRLTAVLVNAVSEQQRQLEAQRRRIEELERRLGAPGAAPAAGARTAP